MVVRLPDVEVPHYFTNKLMCLQACEYSLAKELQAYEVEYHVLQEELAISPQHTEDFQKLKEANKNLKRQNLDLLEQLHHANSHQHALETSNQVQSATSVYHLRL